MRFTLNGTVYDIDPGQARARLAGHPSEPLQTHWVELDGQRWPPKQALEVIVGAQRAGFTSHRASDILSGLGFATSRDRAPSMVGDAEASVTKPAAEAVSVRTRDKLHAAVDRLADFMDGLALTARVATVEAALVGADSDTVAGITRENEIGSETLQAALAVRASFGRVSDVIHALVITLALPRILLPGETIDVRPSLAAGNDPSRKFDLETNKRVAEFKVSAWTGTDAMRKRGTFVDLVHVALDETGRDKYVYVLGEQPKRFLETTISTAAWGFNRKSALQRDAFEERWGPATGIAISDFRRTHAKDVNIVNLYDVLPELRDLGDSPFSQHEKP